MGGHTPNLDLLTRGEKAPVWPFRVGVGVGVTQPALVGKQLQVLGEENKPTDKHKPANYVPATDILVMLLLTMTKYPIEYPREAP